MARNFKKKMETSETPTEGNTEPTPTSEGEPKSPVVNEVNTQKELETPATSGLGRGKGLGKGLGKGYVKRRKKPMRDNLHGITKPAIRRLARRGGVKRISGKIYDEVRNVLKEFLTGVVKDAIIYMEHAKRKTVTATDVTYALKISGKTIYGFGY